MRADITTETVVLTATRYTLNGTPTCGASFYPDNRQVCEFLGTVRMGTIYVCGYHGCDQVDLVDDPFLLPHAGCPLWSKEALPHIQ